MTKEQFIEKAKELGYNEDEINSMIALHEQAEANGINMPYELSVVEKPIAY